MKTALLLQGVRIDIDRRCIVESATLSLGRGQIGCLLGPSGSGKTTLLHCIAGFRRAGEGGILLDGELIESPQVHLPTENRRIGMMFQDYALFPHLTAEENIRFGIRRLPKRRQRERVRMLLNLTGIPECAGNYPHELSGGEQQRVALARALAPGPRLLLLDEPFSNLDAELRLQLAEEIREILLNEGITTFFITHDQGEALAISDQLGVMHSGRILQWDTAYNVYHRPATREVATFVGMGVMLKGSTAGDGAIETALGRLRPMPQDTQDHGADREVDVLIRPDDIIHDDASALQAVISKKQFRGNEFLYRLRLPGGEFVHCFAPSHHDHQVGEAIGIRIDIEHVVVFPRE